MAGYVGGEVFAATEPLIYNVTMTTKNTQYSQVLPSGTKRFAISVQGGADTDIFRIAFVTGKVATPTAPYIQLPGNVEYYEDNVNLDETTVYIACVSDSKVAQIIAWR